MIKQSFCRIGMEQLGQRTPAAGTSTRGIAGLYTCSGACLRTGVCVCLFVCGHVCVYPAIINCDILMTYYNKSIALFPCKKSQAPVPYVNRALAHESIALQAPPDTPTRQHALQAALDDLAIAIQLDPKEFTAFFNRGNVLLRMGDFTAASSSYTQAADLAPGIAGYRLRAGTLYYQIGDTARALSTVRGVLRRNPRYAEAHLVLALILWEDGQRTAAEEEYAVATSLDDELGAGMDVVRRVTLWPPKLYDALSRFRAFV